MTLEMEGLLKMTTRYTTTAIILHWLIALLIFVLFPLGLYMHGLKLSPTKLHLYSYHKWAGMTVLLLAFLRVVWRTTHKPPPLTQTLSRGEREQTNACASFTLEPNWQQTASNVVHALLYLLIMAVPLSGWLMSSAKGVKTVWLGVIPLPDLVEKDQALGQLLGFVHQSLNYTLLALVMLHIAAALKHRFIDKDDVLSRMLPVKKS